MLEYKDIVSTLTTLVAAFAGAWGAFLLENLRKEKEIESKNIGAANRAIYTIYNLWNVLEQYRKESLEPLKDKNDAWLNVPASVTIPTGISTFQTDELHFLLEQSKPEIYAGLFLEEQRFAIAINLIKTRSTLVLDKVFPKMAAVNIRVGQSASQDDIEKALGIDITHQLKEITKAIYENVYEDIPSLISQYENLRAAIKELYPKRKIIKIKFQTD